MTPARLAAVVGVDPKSVERWVAQGRMPRARTRAAVAEALNQDEIYLWPELLAAGRSTDAPMEIVQLWPARDTVPGEVWRSLIGAANSQVWVLVYAGGFIVEAFGLVDRIRELSAAGAQVRVLLGDPDSTQVAQRGVDEGLPSLPHRAASTYEYLGPVRDLPGVQVRVHSTPLYVSLYRFDEVLMVNPHTHGLPAKDNPILQIRQLQGGRLFAYYAAAFERVWKQSYLPGEKR